MALKLANDEEQKETSGGINLSDGNNNQPITEKKNEDPWDFGVEDRPFVVSSASSAISVETKEEVRSEKAETALKIGKILMYSAYVLVLIIYIGICMQSKVDILMNMLKNIIILFIPVILVFVDAVIVCKHVKKSYWLFAVWWFGFCFYPMARNKHVDDRFGTGILCTLLYFVANGLICVPMFQAIGDYRELIYVFDDKTRTEAAIVMDQTLDNGSRLGDHLNDYIWIDDAEYVSDVKKTVVILSGDGSVGIDSGYLVDKGYRSVDTKLAFTKKSNGKYELTAISFDGERLPDEGVPVYWKNVIMQ